MWVQDKAGSYGRVRALAQSARRKEAQAVAIESTKAYRQLKKSLLESLEARGLVEDVYRDKVAEYMTLWVQLRELQADVKDRGVVVMDDKRGMLVENRSVSLATQVSKQMLAIYTALGLKPAESRSGPPGYDADEL